MLRLIEMIMFSIAIYSLLILADRVHAFAPCIGQRVSTFRTVCLAKSSKDDAFVAKLEAINEKSLPAFFTGGAFDNADEEASKIAAKIKSVGTLGWTAPPKRRGDARPRHRAYGGETEKAVQDKPNYDENSPLCVEKWLSLDDFYELVRSSGPAADTVFVALAGGAAFCERVVVEEKLQQWQQQQRFNKEAFLNSVQEGRFQLFAGWALFLSLNLIIVISLIDPTNPFALALESAVGHIREVWRDV